jgi:hypothetical protein
MIRRLTRRSASVSGLALTLAIAMGGCGESGSDSGGDPGDEPAAIQQSAIVVDVFHPRYDGSNGSPTVCTVGGVTMHCCRPGEAMIGAHVVNNIFKCAPLASDERSGSRFADFSLPVSGVHQCASGAVMVGYHAVADVLACQLLPRAANNTLYDPPQSGGSPTTDGMMHVCPSSVNFAMSGIGSTNRFLCRSDFVGGHG